MFWQFWWGRARCGVVGNGEVGQGSAVKVRFAVFRPVMACSGKARYGKSWLGKDGSGVAVKVGLFW